MTLSRVSLVTGAGSGIGRAIAIALSHAGYQVVLVGRRESLLQETAGMLSGPSLVHAADIGDAAQARGAVQACVAKLGRLDVLVHNAGLGQVANIPQTSDELLEAMYRVNTFGPAWMTREAWGTFASQHGATGVGGCVVTISSMASIDPFPGFCAYAGSKAAASIMAASVAKEGAAIGVRAFALAPGAVETPMLRAAFDEAMISREQTLEPGRVAEIVLACVRGEHDALNGRNIPVLPEAFKGWYREFQASHGLVDAL